MASGLRRADYCPHRRVKGDTVDDRPLKRKIMKEDIKGMVLTEDDYRAMASQISTGHNIIEYEKDGLVLAFDCDYECDGFVEDDYLNGTGAFVETWRNLSVENAEFVDPEGHSTPFDIDERLLEKFVA